MKISARNCFKGIVENVNLGPNTATIKIEIESPGVITAIISKESADDLDIKIGDELSAIIKSTEVIVAKDL
jgi:molybdopterin-binding protein